MLPHYAALQSLKAVVPKGNEGLARFRRTIG